MKIVYNWRLNGYYYTFDGIDWYRMNEGHC